MGTLSDCYKLNGMNSVGLCLWGIYSEMSEQLFNGFPWYVMTTFMIQEKLTVYAVASQN